MNKKRILAEMANIITILSIKLLNRGFEPNELEHIFVINGMSIQDAKKIVNNIMEEIKND